MVCAFLPLFTMRGPEGQLFGPMADTYAFALGGALILAVTLTPVLCMFFFKTLKPTADNLLVRILKVRYLNMLKLCLRFRWVTIAVMGGLIVGTCFLVPHLGNEFMPELEEGNLWIRGTSSLNTNLEWGSQVAKQARAIMMSYPEVEQVISQLGRPDDGTDSCGFYNCEYFVPLKPQSEWPAMIKRTNFLSALVYGEYRPRTKSELIKDMNDELDTKLPGTNWGFSQNIRDNVMESLSGVKGDNSVKIFGPDLEKLQELADDVKKVLQKVPGDDADLGRPVLKRQPQVLAARLLLRSRLLDLLALLRRRRRLDQPPGPVRRRAAPLDPANAGERPAGINVGGGLTGST
jgi:cobalt-zinc-cadmium resistance protein CzcA